MNRDKLNWGLVLLFIGVMWLLSNAGVITFYWSSLWRFWPVFLIILGVNLLFPKQGVGQVISVVATIAILAFVGFQATKPSHFWELRHQWNENGADEHTDHHKTKHTTFTEPYQPTIKRAHLEIKGGAVAYTMKGTADDLFHAESQSTFARHALQSIVRDSVAELSFLMKKNDQDKNWDLNDGENKVQMALHPNPLWDIQVDVGAGSVEFDLSRYRINELRLKGGAASFEVNLGKPVHETKIYVESGVADVEIEIPKQVEGQIKIESGLSSKDFPGFVKLDDNTYVTEGFTGAKERFLIQLKGGLSSFSVRRY